MHHYIDDCVDTDKLKKQLSSGDVEGILQMMDGKVKIICKTRWNSGNKDG